ncbi:MAG: hypothetical protein WB539_02040, partial [Planktothrix agardhii]|uniref:hypothetical protein n=1 Tax=Planktothrix agardhii TaxID=1160 RepID=UPI003C5F7DF1
AEVAVASEAVAASAASAAVADSAAAEAASAATAAAWVAAWVAVVVQGWEERFLSGKATSPSQAPVSSIPWPLEEREVTIVPPSMMEKGLAEPYLPSPKKL